jgi:hypothetical protein
VWIQLLSVKHLDTDGKTRQHFPGDWVDVGKQAALKWIADGTARAAKPIDLEVGPGCGVVLLAESESARAVLSRIEGLSVSMGEPGLVYERTLLWDPSVPLRLDLLAVGFKLLERWEAAAPFVSYTQFAADLGSAEDRQKTEAVCRDLRVPLYDPRLLYVKRCEATERLLELWREEGGGDVRHAFLRALYRSLAVVCALPTTWTEGK